MRKYLILASFLFLAACQDGAFPVDAALGTAKAKNPDNTIIGGDVVDSGSDISKLAISFKSLLQPLDNQTGTQKVAITQCTASALTRRIVLTAAHCINGDNLSYVEVMDGGTMTTIPVVKTIINEDFKNDQYADLAIAVLRDDLPEKIMTVSIPNPDMKVDLQKIDIISAGYGRTNDAPTADPTEGLGILRVVLLKISAYDFNDSKFLVDQSNGKGFCQGDSGGPGMFQYEGKYYIMGVASKTVVPENSQTTTCSFRGAYVNLLKFKNWIETTTTYLTRDMISAAANETEVTNQD
ncbi:S1 family peptidase [Bdellovibrio sp. HCB209]|uniref:S1 family peptidase n=1 Tax=Bdellovibrio sp. HCB209 TaxID=3394354 RepID=UPI0039B6923C